MMGRVPSRLISPASTASCSSSVRPLSSAEEAAATASSRLSVVWLTAPASVVPPDVELLPQPERSPIAIVSEISNETIFFFMCVPPLILEYIY